MSKKENKYQTHVISRIHDLVPDCLVLKSDPNYIQGIPDLLILHKDRWAALEVKRSEDSPHRPNQDYYVSHFNEWAYASFIFPENEEEVLDALQRALES